jgi:hypothetical protein
MLEMGGTLPGTLFHVRRQCVRGVILRARLVVGFGAIMIGGASVIWTMVGMLLVSELSTLCSAGSITLCSCGISLGAHCRSLVGSNYLCDGHIRVHGAIGGASVDNFSLTRVSTHALLFDSSSCKVVTSSSETSFNSLTA